MIHNPTPLSGASEPSVLAREPWQSEQYIVCVPIALPHGKRKAPAFGALRPVEQLQMIFGYRNAFLYPERVFLPGIGNLLDDAGQLKDADISKRLKSQAEGFVDFVERLKGVKLRHGK